MKHQKDKVKRKKNPVYNHIKKKRRINLTKELKALYSENYKILMKEI